MFFEVRISFENNGIFRSFQKFISVNISTEGHEFSSELQCIPHSNIFWMTRKWDDIATFKCGELIKDSLSYFRERKSIPFERVSFGSSLGLNGLECHSTDTFLLGSEFEYFSDFLIILSFFNDYYECC